MPVSIRARAVRTARIQSQVAANTTSRADSAAVRPEDRCRHAFADNDVGRLLEDFILQGGVDTQFIMGKWHRARRNG